MSAASYGTILVLAALALIDADDVSSGLGWELAWASGAATWIAHLYAESSAITYGTAQDSIGPNREGRSGWLSHLKLARRSAGNHAAPRTTGGCR